MSIKDIKAALEQALKKYHESPSFEATERVQAVRRQLVAAIVDGAHPCPDCGQSPVGLEQPRRDGRGVEYEIGCSQSCGQKVRGGPMPMAAVDAWNAGIRL